MRRLVALAAFAVVAPLFASIAPAEAGPLVEVKRDSCGNQNVYVNGHPVFVYNNVWCPPPPEDS